jgi:hypothetical protein
MRSDLSPIARCKVTATSAAKGPTPSFTGTTLPHYGLVCGQGQLEACTLLGQREIPAIVIAAAEAECLMMSLVENRARHQHRAIDLLQDIQTPGVIGRNRGSPRRLTARAILAPPSKSAPACAPRRIWMAHLIRECGAHRQLPERSDACAEQRAGIGWRRPSPSYCP